MQEPSFSGAIPELRRLLDDLNIPDICHGARSGRRSTAISPITWGWSGCTERAQPTWRYTNRSVAGFWSALDDRVTGEPTRFAPNAKIIHLKLIRDNWTASGPANCPSSEIFAQTIPALDADLRRASLPDWERLARRRMWTRAGPSLIRRAWLSRPCASSMNFSADCRKISSDCRRGQHQMWAAQRYRSSSPRGFITSGGLGAMGFALPAAVGVQLAKPDSCVLCVSGDGGFQMNIQELATVQRLGLPIKMVIVDNKYLGMVRQWQQLFYERNYSETDLSDNPDFVEIAKAYRSTAGG